MNKNILLLGGKGLLGSKISPYFCQKGNQVFIQTRSDEYHSELNTCVFNLDDTSEFINFLNCNSIDVVVNLVAETNVDLCSKSPNHAYRANSFTVKSIVRAFTFNSLVKKPHLIHISTDQVYSGHGPHLEDSEQPCNVYGLTKYLAESFITEENSTIFRTNLICNGELVSKPSLCDWIVNSLRQEKQINVFKNVLFSPLHTSTIAHYIILAIEKRIYGVFNLGSRSGKSKADLATMLCVGLNLDETLLIASDYDGSDAIAVRPEDMRLDVNRIEIEFNITMPTFEQEINKTIKEFTKNEF